MNTAFGYGLGRSIYAIAGQVSDTLAASAQGYRDLESALTRTLALTGRTGEAYDSARRVLSEFAAAQTYMGYSAVEALDAVNAMIKAGYSLEDAIDTSTSTMALARVGMMDTASAGTALVQVLNLFEISSEQSMAALDLLNRAAVRGKDDLAGYVNALSIVGVTAKFLGISYEDLLAAIVLVNDQVQTASRSATALRRMLQILITDYEKYNIELYDAEGRTRDFSDIIGQLREEYERLQRINPALAKQYIGQFGTWAVDAAGSLIEYGETIDDVQRQMSGLGNITDQLTAIMGTHEGQLQQTQAEIENTKASYGEMLSSLQIQLTEWATDFGLPGVVAVEAGSRIVDGIITGIGIAAGGALATKIGAAVAPLLGKIAAALGGISLGAIALPALIAAPILYFGSQFRDEQLRQIEAERDRLQGLMETIEIAPTWNVIASQIEEYPNLIGRMAGAQQALIRTRFWEAINTALGEGRSDAEAFALALDQVGGSSTVAAEELMRIGEWPEERVRAAFEEYNSLINELITLNYSREEAIKAVNAALGEQLSVIGELSAVDIDTMYKDQIATAKREEERLKNMVDAYQEYHDIRMGKKEYVPPVEKVEEEARPPDWEYYHDMGTKLVEWYGGEDAIKMAEKYADVLAMDEERTKYLIDETSRLVEILENMSFQHAEPMAQAYSEALAETIRETERALSKTTDFASALRTVSPPEAPPTAAEAGAAGAGGGPQYVTIHAPISIGNVNSEVDFSKMREMMLITLADFADQYIGGRSFRRGVGRVGANKP
jgi:TP901 family phage tail tape measure protein